MFNFWPFSRDTGRARDSPDDSHEDCTDWNVDTNNPKDQRRVHFSAFSTTVYGHPSTGGVLVLSPCNAVDLDFLGLARLEPAKRYQDAAEEDRHCALMRKLGARWFKSLYDYSTMPYFEPLKFKRIKVVVAAWPSYSPGVWVAVVRDCHEASLVGLGRVWNAVSMDERCEVVEELGGTYYADPLLCPDLHLLEDDDTANDGYKPRRGRQLITVPKMADMYIGD
ncbi:hypothetical protein F5Y07DRAFT_237895 [Xylaria sp. FL0933]|nr:hypothetical protein F5Y07DRAFT_237895 [Xylaria sp. FL0933]